MSHLVNILKNITNPKEVKSVSNSRKKKTVKGCIWGNWKGYNKIDGGLYPVMCTATAYIPDLSVNIFSVMHAITKEFNMTT